MVVMSSLGVEACEAQCLVRALSRAVMYLASMQRTLMRGMLRRADMMVVVWVFADEAEGK